MVLADFDAFMQNYANCLRKASALAMRLVVNVKDTQAPNVNRLAACMRHGREPRFLDRLLVFPLIEYRGAEDSGAIVNAFGDAPLKASYRSHERPSLSTAISSSTRPSRTSMPTPRGRTSTSSSSCASSASRAATRANASSRCPTTRGCRRRTHFETVVSSTRALDCSKAHFENLRASFSGRHGAHAP